MEKAERKSERTLTHLMNYLGVITMMISLLTFIFYIAWFVASVEKRVSMIEQNETEFQSDLSDLKNSIAHLSDHSETQENVFQKEIEQIYQILLEGKLTRLPR